MSMATDLAKWYNNINENEIINDKKKKKKKKHNSKCDVK